MSKKPLCECAKKLLVNIKEDLFTRYTNFPSKSTHTRISRKQICIPKRNLYICQKRPVISKDTHTQVAKNYIRSTLCFDIVTSIPVTKCVACCSVLLCVAVCCCALQCVAVCCSVLQCVAMCCSRKQLHPKHSVF